MKTISHRETHALQNPEPKPTRQEISIWHLKMIENTIETILIKNHKLDQAENMYRLVLNVAIIDNSIH